MISAVILRQLLLFKQSPIRLISLLYSPLFELLIWIFITKYLHTIPGNAFSLTTLFLSAAIFWSFFSRIQQGFCASFVEDLRSRNLLNLYASPLDLREYLAGLVGVNILTGIFSLFVTAFAALFLCAYNILQFEWALLPFLLTLFLFGWSIGIFTIALVLRFGSSMEILIWSAPTIILPLSGVFYPIKTLPAFLQPIAYALPTTHTFEGMRQIVLQGRAEPISFIASLILSVCCFILSVVIFTHCHKATIKFGLLSRLLANS